MNYKKFFKDLTLFKKFFFVIVIGLNISFIFDFWWYAIVFFSFICLIFYIANNNENFLQKHFIKILYCLTILPFASLIIFSPSTADYSKKENIYVLDGSYPQQNPPGSTVCYYKKLGDQSKNRKSLWLYNYKPCPKYY